MPQANQVMFDTDALRQFWADRIADALNTQKQLSAQAQVQIQAVAAAVAPLMQSMLQEMLGSTNPTVQQQYLQGLAGIIAAKTAEVVLDALEAERELAVRSIQNALQIALQTAAALLKIALVA